MQSIIFNDLETTGVYDGTLVRISGTLLPLSGILLLMVWDSFFPNFSGGTLPCLN